MPSHLSTIGLPAARRRDFKRLCSRAVSEVRVNELTGVEFRWASVVTLIGEIDVVADPAVVTEDPTAGGVVTGAFWLSGRIASSQA